MLGLVLGIVMALAWEWYSLPAIPKPALVPPPPQFDTSIPELVPLEECVPEAWLDMLASHSVDAKSFVEATAHVLRLKVIAYCDRLAELESAARKMSAKAGFAEWDGLASSAVEMNSQWLSLQCEAVGTLVGRQEMAADLSNVAQQLEDILLQQTAQIETSRMNLEAARAEKDLNGQVMIPELLRMISCAHDLRDCMQRSLAAILAAEQRFDEFEDSWQIDPMGGVANRAGLEILLHQWRSSEHHRKVKSSLLLFDLDHFLTVNRKHGTILGDHVLKELTQLLSQNLRRERGFDRLARYSGQQFVTILGGTTPDHAACVAERLRQLVNVSTFKCGDATIPIQVTCGVVELPYSEPMPEVIKRLHLTLSAAKRHERNSTFVDVGSGPGYVEPMPFEGDPPRIEIDSKYYAPEVELEPLHA